MTLYIAPLVEGHTEVGCVASLLCRVWAELLEASEPLHVLQPSRGNRDTLIDPASPTLGVKINEAFANLTKRVRRDPFGRGMLLVLIDAEKDCPRDIAPRLLEEAKKSRSDADIACVLAKRMLENWIVAGASTLAGVNGLPDPLPSRDQFEERSGVAWLDTQMRSKKPSRKFRKTIDAKVFVQKMDLAECQTNSSSFDKLCRELKKRLPVSPDEKALSEA